MSDNTETLPPLPHDPERKSKVNHLFQYLATLRKAGVHSLWVSLGADKDGQELIHVSPGPTVDPKLAAQWPTRTFDGQGVDFQRCWLCNGSGEEDAIAGQGPDAYSVTIRCSRCNGTGVLENQ